MQSMTEWKDVCVVEHTADWALRVRGSDLAALMSNAATGLAGLLVESPAGVPFDEERHITVEALDVESLLVAWLEELAYWAEKETLVWGRVDVLCATPCHLEATVAGGRVRRLDRHIKAVTYHNLRIVETEAGFEATVVFDV